MLIRVLKISLVSNNLDWAIQKHLLSLFTLPHDQIALVHEQLDKARAELDAVKLSVEQQRRDLLRASFA